MCLLNVCNDCIVNEEFWGLTDANPIHFTREVIGLILHRKWSRNTISRVNLGEKWELLPTTPLNQNAVTSHNGLAANCAEPTQMSPWARLSFTTWHTVWSRLCPLPHLCGSDVVKGTCLANVLQYFIIPRIQPLKKKGNVKIVTKNTTCFSAPLAFRLGPSGGWE